MPDAHLDAADDPPVPEAAEPGGQPPPDAGPLRSPGGPAPWRARGRLGVAALAGAGLLVLAGLIAGSGIVSVLLSLAVALIPVAVVAWLVCHLDRFELEPRRRLAVTFLYGATAAVVLAGVLNSLGAGALAGSYDPAATQALAVAGVAPLVEELVKGAAVLVIAWRHRAAISSVLDGVAAGAMVGLGFALTENLTYYVQALAAGGEAFTATVMTRSLLMPLAHPLFTVLLGIGVAVGVRSRRWRWLPPALGLLAAIGLHAMWNAAALTGQGAGVVYLGVLVPVLVIVLAVALGAARRQRRLLRRHLDEEVAAQRLTDAEVATLASPRRRRRAERRAPKGAAHARHSFHYAATQLAFTRHRRRSGRPRAPGADVEAFWLAETQRRRRLADELQPATPAPVEA